MKLEEKYPPKESLNVVIAQVPLISLRPGENAHNIEGFLKEVQIHEEGDLDLLLLPEMWNTGFITGDEEVQAGWYDEGLQWMQKIAHRYHCAVYGSMIFMDGTQRYNRGVFVYPKGEVLTYDKMHLFGPGGEARHYSPGKERHLIQYRGWKLFPTICYDLRFPVWMRWTPSFSYDAILCIASWPQARRRAWKALLKARATENLCYVLACNRVGIDSNHLCYCGDSMIIDPKLSEVKVHHQGEAAIISGTLHKKRVEEIRKKFPSLEDADPFEMKAVQ